MCRPSPRAGPPPLCALSRDSHSNMKRKNMRKNYDKIRIAITDIAENVLRRDGTRAAAWAAPHGRTRGAAGSPHAVRFREKSKIEGQSRPREIGPDMCEKKRLYVYPGREYCTAPRQDREVLAIGIAMIRIGSSIVVVVAEDCPTSGLQGIDQSAASDGLLNLNCGRNVRSHMKELSFIGRKRRVHVQVIRARVGRAILRWKNWISLAAHAPISPSFGKGIGTRRPRQWRLKANVLIGWRIDWRNEWLSPLQHAPRWPGEGIDTRRPPQRLLVADIHVGWRVDWVYDRLLLRDFEESFVLCTVG